MGSSMTLRSLSPALLVVLKVVLGIAGFAGFALLGAGGALLIRHLLTSDPSPAASTLPEAPTSQAQARPEPGASSALPLVVPALPAQAAVAPPEASATPPSLPAPASPGTALGIDAPIETPVPAAGLPRPPVSTHVNRAPHVVHGEAGTTPAAADKASCLATLNAVNADLSLRNEPPTPQQLAILKRGCK